MVGSNSPNLLAGLVGCCQRSFQPRVTHEFNDHPIFQGALMSALPQHFRAFWRNPFRPCLFQRKEKATATSPAIRTKPPEIRTCVPSQEACNVLGNAYLLSERSCPDVGIVQPCKSNSWAIGGGTHDLCSRTFWNEAPVLA